MDQYNKDMGTFGIKSRRFFKKSGNNRTHLVHVFQTGNKEVGRYVNFKEYLITHLDAKNILI